MYKVIKIYWNNSDDLWDLPNVRTVTCGNMEVLGTSRTIKELRRSIKDNPDKFTVAAIRKANNKDFLSAINFSQGKVMKFDDVQAIKDFLDLDS